LQRLKTLRHLQLKKYLTQGFIPVRTAALLAISLVRIIIRQPKQTLLPKFQGLPVEPKYLGQGQPTTLHQKLLLRRQ
jgi:hypothetical protein